MLKKIKIPYGCQLVIAINIQQNVMPLLVQYFVLFLQ
jgi:hypothetical protein